MTTLDPRGLEAAARVVAHQNSEILGHDTWGELEDEQRDCLRGEAAEIVTAYLDAARPVDITRPPRPRHLEAATMIHNHETEQGPGLACREIMTPDGMVGLCQVRIAVACINWGNRDPGAPGAVAYFYRTDTGGVVGYPAYRVTHEEALRWAFSTARKTWPREST